MPVVDTSDIDDDDTNVAVELICQCQRQGLSLELDYTTNTCVIRSNGQTRSFDTILAALNFVQS